MTIEFDSCVGVVGERRIGMKHFAIAELPFDDFVDERWMREGNRRCKEMLKSMRFNTLRLRLHTSYITPSFPVEDSLHVTQQLAPTPVFF